MKNMTVGCIIIGNKITHTQQALQSRKDLNLSDCTKWDQKVDDELMKKIRERINGALPAGIDCFFEHVTSENQMIDVKKADAYIAVPFGNKDDSLFAAFDVVFSALYSKNRPVVFSVLPYEEIWSYGSVFFPYFVRDARKIDEYLGMKNNVYVSKDLNNLREILSALNVKFKVNHSRALCIGEPMYEPFHSWNWGYEMVRAMQEKFGMEWEHISSDRFLKIYKEWDKPFEKNVLAKELKGNHLPDGYDETKAEKMYHVFRELIKESGANVFTVNCLWSIVHNECKTTSCYSLSKLNDEGIVAACEADVTTLLNMMITTFATDSPVFMLNPYHFPEDNKLFVSHCTSPRLHSFNDGKKDDFNIYSYYEIPELPCGLQIIKEEGPVTVTGVSHDKMDKMIVIKGKIVRNTAFSTCRTQMELDVEGDIKEIVKSYQGRHWALCYGDQSNKIRMANDVLGIETRVF
jgi:hypothetical protein